jgi:hypothetical protein
MRDSFRRPPSLKKRARTQAKPWRAFVPSSASLVEKRRTNPADPGSGAFRPQRVQGGALACLAGAQERTSEPGAPAGGRGHGRRSG